MNPFGPGFLFFGSFLIADSNSLLVICSDFLFLSGSVWENSMFVQNYPFLLGCPVCCGSASFSSVICSDSLLRAVFGPHAVIGPVWGYLGLELSQTRHLQRCNSTELQGTWWAEPAVHCWVHSLIVVCGFLFLSLGGRSHFGMVLAPVRAACTLSGL